MMCIAPGGVALSFKIRYGADIDGCLNVYEHIFVHKLSCISL